MCQGSMRVIAFIEGEDIIKKILRHLGLWQVKRRPRPTANAPPIDVFSPYDQTPAPTADDYLTDPDYTRLKPIFSSQERKLKGLSGRSLAKAGFLFPNVGHSCQVEARGVARSACLPKISS